MAATGVAAGWVLARGFGPRVVRAGRLAQPARETVRGLGAQGPAALGAAVGAGLAADPGEGAKLPPAGGQGPRPVEFAGSLRQLGRVWLERAQTPAQRRLCGSVAGRACAGCGAGPGLSGAVSAGESAGASGRAQFRGGSAAAGAAGPASIVKLAIIVVASVGLMLLSYRYFVRSTAIGMQLNGRRYPRGATW